jgi:hypothetical protein
MSTWAQAREGWTASRVGLGVPLGVLMTRHYEGRGGSAKSRDRCPSRRLCRGRDGREEG